MNQNKKTNKMKAMYRKIAIVITLVMMTIGSMQAQIIIQDGDQNANRAGVTDWNEIGLFNPLQGVEYDQYAPLGGGSLLLIGFGSAYLLTKRRRKE